MKKLDGHNNPIETPCTYHFIIKFRDHCLFAQHYITIRLKQLQQVIQCYLFNKKRIALINNRTFEIVSALKS